MTIGRTPEQARKDQAERDRHNLDLRNNRRQERGLTPLTMREYRAERAGRDTRPARTGRDAR